MSAPIWQTLDARSLAQLIGLRHITRKHGGGVMTSCPSHAGQTGDSPPLSLDSEQGQGVVAFCHSCGYKAGALKLTRDAQGLASEAEAARWLEKQLGASSSLLADIPEPTIIRAPAALEESDIDPALETRMLEKYGDEIGFTASQLHEAGLRAAKRNDRLALRLHARDETGVITSWQDIMRADDNGKRAKLSATGLPAPIWGLDTLTEAGDYPRIFICEGISDYLTAAIVLANDANLIAIGAAGAQVIKHAAARAEQLRPSAFIYFVPDHDDAGIAACIEASAPRECLTIALLPADGTDLNDLHMTNYELDHFVATSDTRDSLIDAAEAATGSAITLLPNDRSTHLSWKHEAQALELAGDIDDARARARADTTSTERSELPDTLEVRLGLAGAEAEHPLTGEPFDLWDPDFDTHGILKRIRAHADTQIISPCGLLGVIMSEHAASVAHNWVLPPRAGNGTAGAGSPLSLYFALVAKSGIGKTEANKQGKQVIIHDPHDAKTTTSLYEYRGEDKYAAIQERGTPVSGEAILEDFIELIEYPNLEDPEAPAIIKRVAAKHRARWHFGEIEQLLVTASRTGSTLHPMLRSFWSGEEASTKTATSERSRSIPELSTSIGATAGAQLGTAGALLEATAKGDAQRWIWLPSHGAYDEGEQHESESIMRASSGRIPPIQLPHWKLPDHVQHVTDHAEIRVDPGISADIKLGARTAFHGHPIPGTEAASLRLAEERERTGEDTNQHGTQIRLRIAVAIARICLLAPEITIPIWIWAGAFLSVDRKIRALLTEHGTSEAADLAEARTQARASDRVRSDQAARSDQAQVITDVIDRAAEALCSLAARSQDRTITKSQAIRGISPSIINAAKAVGIERADLRDLALHQLTHEHRIEEIAATEGQRSPRWKTLERTES